MKALAVAGTAAMFLVGGGILTHGIPGVHSWIGGLADGAVPVPGIGGALKWLTPVLLDGLAGMVVGALMLAVVSGARNFLGPKKVGSRS
jgi:hypothetical protein